MNLNVCPCCLSKGFDNYCPRCRKSLFGNIKVSHTLSFTRPDFNNRKLEPAGKISISGVQIKHSLKLVKTELQLTESDGRYLLKPVPSGSFNNLDMLPANEHLTMQIASQVYKINTAKNALIFFPDGEPAYITKRFDISDNGKRFLQEDFAQIAGRTEETNGKNYKYDFSYEEIADLLRKNVGAYKIEIEKFYKSVLFNFIFSNGDAHLKNFSLYRNEQYGDYVLTPFYDLLNTSLHIPNDSDTALELFKDGYMTESYRLGTKFTRVDFEEFAEKIGISKLRAEKILNEMAGENEKVSILISQSFLNKELQKIYLQNYQQKISRLTPR